MGITPVLTGGSFGALLAAVGAIGIGYTCHVVLRMYRRGITSTIDLADRCCYILVPFTTYGTLIATGLLLPGHPDLGLDMLAATQVALLLLGIRNAWDMTLFIVMRTPTR